MNNNFLIFKKINKKKKKARGRLMVEKIPLHTLVKRKDEIRSYLLLKNISIISK